MQASGQQQAAQTQLQMFNTINQQQQPFIQGGYSALNSLLYGLGIPGSPSSAAPPTASAPGPGYNPGGFTPNGVYAGPGGSTIYEGGMTPPPTDPSVSNGSMARYQPSSGTPGPYGSTLAPGTSSTMLPGGQMIPGLTTGAPSGAATGAGAGASGGGVGFGQFTSPFTVSDFMSNLNPGYGFQLKTGEQAVRNADTPSQGALSGATLKDLMGFGEGLANTSYNQAFSNWMTQNNAIFGRLSGIAGLGQNAASNTGTAGATLGTGTAQAQAAAAGSLGAGVIGAGNSIGTGLQSAALLNYLAANPGGAGGGPG